MDQLPAKPAMRVRLRRAGLWLVPFVILAILREPLDVPDELFGKPANGVPPTRLDGLINLATAFSFWIGVLGFLSRLVRDDSRGLAAVLVGLMLLAVLWTGFLMLYILFT